MAITKVKKQDSQWTFLTNHSHVLICLARDPEMTLREVSVQVGITERAVQNIVADLADSGYVKRKKDGRRNTYRLTLAKPLRHPVEKNCTIGDLVSLITDAD